MSTRLYPTFQKGSSKLRVFLPNFWMKLVKPSHNLLPNQVMFKVSPEMTQYDVRQYLEKIYNIPVIHVSTFNKMGKTKTIPNSFVSKEPDDKIAFVTLPKDQQFNFPDIFGKADEEIKEQTKSIQEAKDLFAKKTKLNISKQGVPSWFSH